MNFLMRWAWTLFGRRVAAIALHAAIDGIESQLKALDTQAADHQQDVTAAMALLGAEARALATVRARISPKVGG